MDDVRPPTPPAPQPGRTRVPRPPGLTDDDRRWMAENREAIESFNRWYEENGSPLDQYRSF